MDPCYNALGSAIPYTPYLKMPNKYAYYFTILD